VTVTYPIEFLPS